MDRRSFLAVASASGIGAARPDAIPAPVPGRTVNVRDHGARGDGVTDDTAAFNRATQAAETWSTALESAIVVPAGTYRLRGTVYLRKGQSLIGEGQSSQIDARDATGSTFVMGSSTSVGRRGQDPGGSPVRIENLRTLGGSPRHGLIYTNVAGFSIRGLFMTACGIGIEIEGNDGILSDIYIDQCLNGITLRNCQSIVITNAIWYSANFALSIGSDVRMVSITNSVFSFTRYAALNLEDGARRIRAVVVGDCVFASNEQYESFIGYLHCRASQVEMQFGNCAFRNWPRFAINHAAGEKVSLTFSGCSFDGSRPSDDYNQSSTASALSTGMTGDYRFRLCDFKWLQGSVAAINPGLQRLALEGGAIDGMRGPRFRLRHGAVDGAVVIRDVEGLARADVTGTMVRVTIPALPQVVWRLSVSGRTANQSGQAPFLREMVVSTDQKGAAIALPAPSGIAAAAADVTIERDVTDTEIVVVLGTPGIVPGAFRVRVDAL